MSTGDDIEEVDYYSILNIDKTNDGEEIRAAYHRMSSKFHPDKYVDAHKKSVAEEVFKRIQKAYSVLRDEDTRRIYNIFGQKGLEKGLEIVERKKTNAELYAEYERLQREEEERRIMQRTNPMGSFTLMFDATDMFDEAYYTHRSVWWLPRLHMKGISMVQSIEAPLAAGNTAVLKGAVTNKDSISVGQLSCTLHHVHSNTLFGELRCTAGNAPGIGVKVNKNIGSKTNSYCTFDLNAIKGGIRPSLSAGITRQLTKSIIGRLNWNRGALATRVVYQRESYHSSAELQLCARGNSYASLSHGHNLSENMQMNLTLQLGLLDTFFEYGFDRKISSLSRLAATMSIGSTSGVTLKIILQRHNQSFIFPIHMSEGLSHQAIFYGTALPLLVYWTAKAIIVSPFLRKESDKEKEEARQKNLQLTEERKIAAKEAQELMRDRYNIIVESEQSQPDKGLIILEALYGNLTSEHETNRSPSTAAYIDVVIPLQLYVERKPVGNRTTPQLILPNTSKAQLNGFCDPCIGEKKQLKVSYTSGGLLHQAIFNDADRVVIPRKSHLISAHTEDT